MGLNEILEIIVIYYTQNTLFSIQSNLTCTADRLSPFMLCCLCRFL